MKSPSVCWCFSDDSPQSWPPSLSASSSRGGDVRSADSSTWWHAIQSSQRTSCWRPSSPSAAPYVAAVQPLSLRDRAGSVVKVSHRSSHRTSRLSCVMPIREQETSSWQTELPHGPRFVGHSVKKDKLLHFWVALDFFSAGIPPRRYPGSVLDQPRAD